MRACIARWNGHSIAMISSAKVIGAKTFCAQYIAAMIRITAQIPTMAGTGLRPGLEIGSFMGSDSFGSLSCTAAS
ncbi:hypothetical protein K32_23070 [Kaistia sp. 32K]|nr:hypothetical protein K32_23070 [Kaistia sp. 32K]